MEFSDPLSTTIGQRIARQRARLGQSMDEVAARTGVSRAMVSRIERGEVHASAVVLDRLCAGLDLSLSELFARDATSPLLRRADQPVWQDPSSHYRRREVAPAGTGSPVRIVELEFPAGAEVVFAPSRQRSIDQHVWVLDGAIEIETAGFTYQLAVGDCLHMRVAVGNTFRNTSGSPARYAVIIALEPPA